MTRTLIDHFETYLGEVRQVFEPLREEDSRRFQLLSFDNAPFPGATTLATAGLSSRVLAQPNGPSIRQELVACTYTNGFEENLAGVVDLIGRDLAGRNSALSRGEVLGPAGALAQGGTVEGFTCASPWYWSDGFSRFDGLLPHVLLVWLLPLTASEIEYVKREGIDRFEELVAERDVDFLDLRRASLL